MEINVSRVKQPTKFDFILALILIMIFISSVLAIYAAFPLIPSYLSGPGLLFKQIQFYIIGFIVIGAIMYVGNDSLYDFAIIGYKILLGLLIYLFIDSFIFQRFFGRSILPLVNSVNGATSWYSLPLIGSFQPSEFMKVVLIVICAYVIIEHNENKVDDSFESDFELFKQILKWCLAPLFLIFMQPDTGICIIIVFSILVMLMCSGIRREWILFIGIFLFVVIGFFLFIFIYHQDLFTSIISKMGISQYKIRRIYGWIYPEQYKNGDGLQLYSSLLSLGSAGIFGHGIQSTAISLPESHTDLIFAVIGLNYGLIGTVLVVGLCIALDVRLAIIATRTKNNIEKIMIVGFIGMLVIQQFENIGMLIGFFPITGVTLPLISYGGSSLISYMLAFGIIFNAAKKAKKLNDYVY